ncbi:MAG: radical SAM protein [Patescibacteria group bacterium]|nr:radical SAM protein [Patescibacteria group bacterium]
MKKRVWLVQVNNRFGNQCFLPYSVGLLQTYAQSFPEIKEAYDFEGFTFLREPVVEAVNRIGSVDVCGISCYIWNFSYSMAFARVVKEANPCCLIVLGGPHVPFHSDNFFMEYPYVDLLVHYEGEVTFSEVLREHLNINPDYRKLDGLSVNMSDGTAYKTMNRPRMNNLDEIPSPYLSGTFDELLKLGYDLHPSQECHRGCPFQCQFCDWGSNLYAKVKLFSTERIKEEINWFAKNRMSLLYNCDANFLMFKRDMELVEHMVSCKEHYGYPQKFRAAYAKNSNDVVFEGASKLNVAGMCKGVTLSFQSMDDHTLELVKRKNIKIDNFKELMSRYRGSGIPTYTELIIGLPGETYDTFVNGIDLLLESGAHDGIQAYLAELLPNSEMSDPSYRERHGIQSARVPVLHFHASPSRDSYTEYYEIVIATNTLPSESWLKCLRFAWAVQAFHCLPLTQCLAVYYHQQFNMSYRSFYEGLLEYGEVHPETVVGNLVTLFTKLFRGIPEGKEWGVVDYRFGDVTWPPEEISFLRAIIDKDKFYDELIEWLCPIATRYSNLDYCAEKIIDLVEYQKAVVCDSWRQGEFSLVMKWNTPEVVRGAYDGNIVPHVREDKNYIVQYPRFYGGDLETFAREAVWYNRKGGKFFGQIIGEEIL